MPYPSRRTLPFALLLAAAAVAEPGMLGAQAPERAAAWPAAALPSAASAGPMVHTVSGGEAETGAGLSAPLAGAAVGLLAGAAAGAAIGHLVGPRDDVADGCMFFCVPSGPSMGAALGMLVGPGIGAHMANQRRGSPWATVGASALGVAGGVALGAVAGRSTESVAVALAVGVPIALGVPVIVERATAR